MNLRIVRRKQVDVMCGLAAQISLSRLRALSRHWINTGEQIKLGRDDDEVRVDCSDLYLVMRCLFSLGRSKLRCMKDLLMAVLRGREAGREARKVGIEEGQD